MSGPGLFLLAQDDAWESRFQVTSLAASAVAAGRHVDLALFFAALDAWVAGRWDEPTPARHVAAGRLGGLDLPPLSSLLVVGREAAKAVEEGGAEGEAGGGGEAGGRGSLRVLACSASIRVLGLATADVQRHVDAIAGWPTFHRLIRGAGQVLTF